MSEEIKTDMDQALDTIDEVLGEKASDILWDGLPDGGYPEWGYDERLILDIATACREWLSRKEE